MSVLGSTFPICESAFDSCIKSSSWFSRTFIDCSRTGKTLTAESVAEFAEKPLYRVTCGVIGTDPAAVERHKATALTLGRRWNCVVLLDEADIFLEERSLSDLQRNALVSVFLRMLEYYEGILILTTNRVGTFDEAFESRIQLSLHYDNLTESQRRVIWTNFLTRLKDIDEDNINYHELKQNLRDLAKHDMNGRQIRNALTTARQLAQYKKERMDYRHLDHAIRVSARFDQYLRGVKHGLTSDAIARDIGCDDFLDSDQPNQYSYRRLIDHLKGGMNEQIEWQPVGLLRQSDSMDRFANAAYA